MGGVWPCPGFLPAHTNASAQPLTRTGPRLAASCSTGLGGSHYLKLKKKKSRQKCVRGHLQAHWLDLWNVGLETESQIFAFLGLHLLV